MAFAHCFQLVLNDGIMTDQILDANLLSFVENSLFIKNLDSNFLMLVMLVLYSYQLALWREHQRYADYVFGSLLDFATAASFLLVYAMIVILIVSFVQIILPRFCKCLIEPCWVFFLNEELFFSVCRVVFY